MFLFIKSFVATKMEIPENILFKRDIELDITFTKVLGDLSQYILRSGNLKLEIFKTSVCFLYMTVKLDVYFWYTVKKMMESYY